MRLPNFIMIGAAKCGSTSLHSYLGQHPDIFMCPQEDANFFALEGGRLKPYMPPPSEKIGRKWVYEISHYASLFEGAGNQRAIGESSNLYLNVAHAAGRIHAHCPNARIVAIIRNPVDRAFSNYLHLKGMDLEPSPGFPEALEAEAGRMRDGWHPMWFYRETGFYHRLLQPYFEVFDRSRIGIFLYDDLVRDAVGLVQRVYGFLGVDPTFRPDVSKVHKATGLPRSESLQRFLKKRNPIKSLFKPFLPRQFRRNLGKKVSEKVMSHNLVKPLLAPDIRRKMMEEYRDDLLKLEKLINRDLTGWLQDPVGDVVR